MSSRVRITHIEGSPDPAPSWEKPPGAIRPKTEKPWWIVFSGEVPRGSKLVLGSTPLLKKFQGVRLSVDPAVAASFQILEIRIGNRSCRLDCHGGGAAATLFPPLPHDLTPQQREDYEALLALNLDVADHTTTIRLEVLNTSRETKLFNAVLWGTGVD